MSTGIVLVDDHADVREMARIILSADRSIVVVGECGDGVSALETVSRVLPDIVIMDIMMPELNGLKAIHDLRRSVPAIQVLMLSIHEHAHYVAWSLRAGASGYVLKRSMARDLLAAVSAIRQGERFLSPSLSAVESPMSDAVRRHWLAAPVPSI
ncbi:MAG TPA: response regulator transcription factor [Chloroflexota bacterium]